MKTKVFMGNRVDYNHPRLAEVVISQSSVLLRTDDMLRWAKWTSHGSVISAIACSRNDHVSNKIHQGCTEEA